jgi:4-hydroxy-2-oxoheptanedioate aldolase
MEIGTVLSLPGAALAELAGGSLDFAWIDLEHGALGLADMQAMAVGLAAAGCPAHVRLPTSSGEHVAAVIDAGVDGVVAPRVESAQEARELVSRLRYPPGGRRGFGPRRAGRYGRTTAFWASPERQVTCTVQIESPAGVAAAAEIAAVDGVDALVVGCADLALALDGTLEPASARVREAIAHVQDAAEAAGIASGVAGPDDPRLLRELAGDRSTLLVCAADVRIYARAVDELVERLRAREREALRVGA